MTSWINVKMANAVLLIQFCQKCGAILPIVDHKDGDILRCQICNHRAKCEKVEEYSRYVFDHPWLKDAQQLSPNDDVAEQGPVVERRCSHCGHGRMTYTTQQLRAADEGQTVFYRCVKCKNQEVEDS